MANKLHRAYLDLYNFRSALKACLCLEFRIEKRLITSFVQSTQKECIPQTLFSLHYCCSFITLEDLGPFRANNNRTSCPHLITKTWYAGDGEVNLRILARFSTGKQLYNSTSWSLPHICHAIAVPGKTELLFHVKLVLCTQDFGVIYNERFIKLPKTQYTYH